MRIALDRIAALLPLPATPAWPTGVRDVEAFAHGALSVVLFAPRGIDHQTSHGQDELYVVVAGSGVLTIGGDGRYFGDMLTPAGLAEIKTYADGIGPWKPHVMALTVTPFKTTNADGTAYTGSLADVNSVTPKSLIADAHKAGLFVHTYTFRNEPKYLAGFYKGDPMAEYLVFFRAGIDGVFSDFSNTGVAARAAYLKETGH